VGGSAKEKKMKDLRERCEKLYNDLPSELGKYKRHVDVIGQIESFALQIRNEALKEAAAFVADAYKFEDCADLIRKLDTLPKHVWDREAYALAAKEPE
jgi:hypothetical protein